MIQFVGEHWNAHRAVECAAEFIISIFKHIQLSNICGLKLDKK